MPFSWLKVPTGTSRKIHQCAGPNPTKVKFESCVQDIVASDGGSVDGQIRYEGNGKFAHVHVCYDTQDQKRRIVYDLDAVEVVDLYSAEEIDEMSVETYTPPAS